MILFSRPKIFDLYTLSQSKLIENRTLHSGTYLYSPYMAVALSPRENGLTDALQKLGRMSWLRGLFIF